MTNNICSNVTSLQSDMLTKILPLLDPCTLKKFACLSKTSAESLRNAKLELIFHKQLVSNRNDQIHISDRLSSKFTTDLNRLIEEMAKKTPITNKNKLETTNSLEINQSEISAALLNLRAARPLTRLINPRARPNVMNNEISFMAKSYNFVPVLPSELINEILLRGNSRTLQKFACASKSFAESSEKTKTEWINHNKFAVDQLGFKNNKLMLIFIENHGKDLKYLRFEQPFKDLLDPNPERIIKSCSNLQSLALDLKCSTIESSQEIISNLINLRNLTTIALEVDFFKELNLNFAIKNLQRLRKFDLKATGCYEKSIKLDCFGQELQKLSILGNRSTQIDLTSAEHLKKVSLKTVSEVIGLEMLKSLEYLTIDPAPNFSVIENLSGLKKLNVCISGSIMPSFKNLIKLEKLKYVQYMGQTPSFAPLTSLKILVIENISAKKIPGLNSLTNLEYLEIKTPLQKLNLCNLKHLKECKILQSANIINGLEILKSLESLSINFLEDFSTVENLSILKKLNVRTRGTIMPSFEKLINLEELKYMQVSGPLPSFAPLTSLKSLVIENKSAKMIPGLNSLTNLEYLELKTPLLIKLDLSNLHYLKKM